MNVLQLHRARELFEQIIIEQAKIGRFIEEPERTYAWLNFKSGFQACLSDTPPALSQQQIVDIARKMTVIMLDTAQNPYQRNSAQYRWWQDGVRMGREELEDSGEM